MAGTSLIALIDDIASILDDVALLTKVAAKKTAGVLGDDLALNAEQVAGVHADRELPVVWAVAKGSLVNKAILVPLALAISTLAAWAITPLLMVGGAFLCFEGCEKLAEKLLHGADEDREQAALRAALADPATDLVAFERDKIKGAIRTDFVLSAEIVTIALGTVAAAPFGTRVGVLAGVGLVMTVGVYGLVAGIVKLDDLGLYLYERGRRRRERGERVAGALARGLGVTMLKASPYLMKALSIGGTIAMFLVGGGILVHGIPGVHERVEQMAEWARALPVLGRVGAAIAPSLLSGLVGLAAGILTLLGVSAAKRALR